MRNLNLYDMPVSYLMHSIQYDKESTLCHYGIKGMRWGHRKPQNTVETAHRNRASSQAYSNYQQAKQAYKDAKKAERQSPEAKAARKAAAKKAVTIGAAVIGTALAAYGTYKLAKFMKDKKIAKEAAAARAAQEEWRKTVQTAIQNRADANFYNPNVKYVNARAGNYAFEYGKRGLFR